MITTPEFTLSQEQENILSALQDPNSGHLCIDAKAGAAKTTTIELGAKEVPETLGLAIAFSASIKETLAKRLPEKIFCKTFHALGYGVWRKKCSAKHKLEKFKQSSLCAELWGDTYKKEFLMDVRDVAERAKSKGLVPSGASSLCHGLRPDDIQDWVDIADSFGVLEPKQIAALARELVRLSIKKAFQGNHDFTDMVYMPVITRAPFQQYPIVFVDEAQDLSPLQHHILGKVIAPTGRCIFVGDPHQSIYGFAGARLDSMDALQRQLSATTYPLNTSFRCASAIIAEAQNIVPEIKAWSEAPEGLVESYSQWDLEDLQPSDVVLCRNNAPLIALAAALIKSGTLCSIKGRDIGKHAINLVEKICSGKPLTSEALGKRVLSWITGELEKNSKYIESKVDRARCILILCDMVEDSAEVIDQLGAIFLRNYPNAINLSSIHRAKGMEWDRVWILDEHLMPSKYAKTEDALIQETNLHYVAITRAKKALFYITSKECTTELAKTSMEEI